MIIIFENINMEFDISQHENNLYEELHKMLKWFKTLYFSGFD